LRLELLLRGIAADLHVGGYNGFVGEMLDPVSELSKFAPEVVVLVNTPFNVPEWPEMGSTRENVERLVDGACDALLGPCQLLHERTNCMIVVNNLHSPQTRPLGNLGAKMPGDPTNFVRRVNLALGDRAPGYVQVNDVAALVERKGLDAFFDSRFWFHAKQPVSFDCLCEYVANTAAIVGSLLGKTRKCAIVDLDNTLWGGIVGDDGVDGIEIGEGAPRGEAFKAFQLYLLSLRNRGIVLAVCSKNDMAIAKSAIESHPEMALSLEDFVAFKANWAPKSDNVKAIAKELNLGLDSFVFIDDNPAERDQVRQALPEVAVPELSDEPADYPRIIEAGRYFEIAALTAEDGERTESYQARHAAAEALESATDLSEYLTSLKMVAAIRPFEPVSMERITQLTNKTNQFNLTTRRVTLAEMESIANDPAYLTRSVRLRDRFGDHGLISVLFARVEKQTMTIDAWLMSCRVLKRGVEEAQFNELVREAWRRNVKQIIGIYVPTDRNRLVRDHYESLGFELMGPGSASGETRWRLDVSKARALENQIEVEVDVDVDVEPRIASKTSTAGP
jgi:FkbH-like protein